MFVAIVVPLIVGADVTVPVGCVVFGEDNFVVTVVRGVRISDVGDVIVVLSAPENGIIFVVTRVVVALVVVLWLLDEVIVVVS